VISKAQIKFIKSLQIKKFRQEHGQFIVQGKKNILELIDSNYSIKQVYATDTFYSELLTTNVPIETISQKELEQISSFQSNKTALAIVDIPPNDYIEANNDWVIVLDQVKDPGNLGTIIRIADWYGVSKLVCSPDCVDSYNPKVINASMGSFCRVKTYYTALEPYLAKQKEAIFGALLEGKPIYTSIKPTSGYLLMGSESHGIAETLKKHINHQVSIPRLGKAESLNVAVATAILCDNLLSSTLRS